VPCKRKKQTILSKQQIKLKLMLHMLDLALAAQAGNDRKMRAAMERIITEFHKAQSKLLEEVQRESAQVAPS
jgi:hypothetical protein